MQALGIAVKLTFQGNNQFRYRETYYCILVGNKPCNMCVAHSCLVLVTGSLLLKGCSEKGNSLWQPRW